MTKKLILIDGYSIAFRAFYGMPLLSNANGIHTNAIYGFANMINKVIANEKPTHVMVAFDAGKTNFRHEFFTEYKAGRSKTPPELIEQFPFIRALLNASGIFHYELPKFEADDIIGTIARKAEQEDFEVRIISGDKDLTQLASDKTTVLITRKGITETEDYTPDYIQEKYGLAPLQIIDLKGLMGDSSDNIPGVPGVGEKTALKLLHQFGSVETVVDSTEQISGKKLVENLTNFREQALVSKQLATIEINAPIECEIQDLAYNGFDVATLKEFYKEMGMKTFVTKLEAMSTDVEDADDEVAASFEYEIATEVTNDMLSHGATVYVEILDENYFHGEILGLSISSDSKNFFVPLEILEKSEALKKWLSDPKISKCTYDVKRTVIALRRLGVELKGIEFDVFLAAYILKPDAKIEDVASVVTRYSKLEMSTDEEFYGKGAKRTVPELDKLSLHIAKKSAAISDAISTMKADLEAHEQFELLNELELPLAIILAEMEWTGVKVDSDRLKKMGAELLSKITELELEIYMLAGEHFNINSPKQLGVILFEKLELPVIKKTKTGYSTAADVLEALAPKHAIVDLILQYRQLAKLQSTYVDGLLKVIHEDGKVHSRFNQALTQTGRLSSSDPNLQNIPIRIEEGRKIRQAFTASEEGWQIFAADYSQIELRVLAHFANDEGLIEAFRAGIDVHSKTAMDVFGVSMDEVDSNMRRQAKAVNFGIVYGISDFGLSQNLGITRKEASQFIDKYLATFPGVDDFMKDIVLEARKEGFVKTLLNRRRFIPDIRSSNFNLRSFAERTAMNTPIQGSAADIIKIAMIKMQARLEKEGLKTKMLLQVHDELIFEAPEEEIEILKQIVPEEMESALELIVPLKVDYNFGKTWYEAK